MESRSSRDGFVGTQADNTGALSGMRLQRQVSRKAGLATQVSYPNVTTLKKKKQLSISKLVLA